MADEQNDQLSPEVIAAAADELLGGSPSCMLYVVVEGKTVVMHETCSAPSVGDFLFFGDPPTRAVVTHVAHLYANTGPVVGIMHSITVFATTKTTTKKTKGVHPNRAAVIDAFDAAYREATGTKPTWSLKALNLANQLAKNHPLQEVEARIHRCYKDRKPDWIWRDGTPDMGAFVQSFDRLAKPAAQEIKFWKDKDKEQAP